MYVCIYVYVCMYISGLTVTFSRILFLPKKMHHGETEYLCKKNKKFDLN